MMAMEESIPLRRRAFYAYSRWSDRIEDVLFSLGMLRDGATVSHAAKRRVVRDYAALYHLHTLVETGTYLGDMIVAMLPHFDELYSIELSDNLYRRAVLRFRREPRVHLYAGNSGSVVRDILALLRQPALFWLDAHYSGGGTARGHADTPVVDEMNVILRDSRAHVILIDDARMFDGTDNYPTMDEVHQLVAKLRPEYTTELVRDIIRIAPPRT